MAYYLIIPLYLLPILVVLCLVVRMVAPHRRRLQRVVVGASLGCWVGFCLPAFYDLNLMAELVRQTKLKNSPAYAVLQGLGVSGSHNEFVWFWNLLVIDFWLILLVSFLAYYSVRRTGTRTLVGLVGGLVLLASRVLYYANQPVDQYPPLPAPQPLQLTLRQPGLLSYPLGNGQVEQVRYDSVCFLVLSGTLPRGEQLRVHFQAGTLATPQTTNVVEVQVDGQALTHTVGISTYYRATNTLTGNFTCVLPNGQPLHGSFVQGGLTIP
jgi:hypothetical protein